MKFPGIPRGGKVRAPAGANIVRHVRFTAYNAGVGNTVVNLARTDILLSNTDVTLETLNY